MNIDQKLFECLPLSVQKEIIDCKNITEIRLTENGPLTLRVDNRQYITHTTIDADEMKKCVSALCQNSVHTFFESIKNGYIPFENGYRIGVSGNAITRENRIENITKITSINIRIPSQSSTFPPTLLEKLSNKKGILIFSGVNCGKTTLVKNLIKQLSLPPHNKRISVIDSKKEIYCKKIHSGLPIDFFVGYPKYSALEMAIVNMSPDIIVCDEIGINDDSQPFIECKNCGVELILTAHAKNRKDLIQRKTITELIKNDVFECFVQIKNQNNERVFEILSSEELLS